MRVNYYSTKGECVFEKPIPARKDIYLDNFDQQIKSYLTHIAELKDDRLLALTADLLVESALEQYLSTIMPSFKSDLSHINLAMKISIAKALRLTPTKLFDSAKVIHKLRNYFAHELAIKKFSDLADAEKLIDNALGKFELSLTTSLSLKFVTLTYTTLLGITMYIHSLNSFNSFIRNDKFRDIIIKSSLEDT